MLAIGCVVVAVGTWETLHWFAAPFLHAALSFFLLATAYAGAGAAMLLKQASGRRSLWGWLLFGPYFVLNTVAFHLYRLFSREPPSAQVAPRVFFGRRLTARECVAGGWTGVLDLAGEFAEAKPLRELAGYRSLPLLDATAPTEEQLRAVVGWIGESVTAGPVLIHCALGHGRSACVVIAYLLSAGHVARVDEGERFLQSLRSGVRLHPCQRERLQSHEPSSTAAACRDREPDLT